jgi:hypothetical protein
MIKLSYKVLFSVVCTSAALFACSDDDESSPLQPADRGDASTGGSSNVAQHAADTGTVVRDAATLLDANLGVAADEDASVADASSPDAWAAGFTACGGDPAGEWEIVGSELTSFSFPWCPTMQLDIRGVTMAGDMRFLEGAVYKSTMHSVGSMHMTMPAECLMGQSCSEFQSNLKIQTGDEFGDITCTGEGDCRCEMPGALQNKIGMYSVDDALLTVSSFDKMGMKHSVSSMLCIKDGTLQLRTEDSGGSPVYALLTLKRKQ